MSRNRTAGANRIFTAWLWVLLFHALVSSAGQTPVLPYSFNGDLASRCFKVYADGIEIPVAEVPPMDAAERERLAEAYRKLPSYCHIYDPACMQLHFAQLAADGDVRVQVKVDEKIREFKIHTIGGKIEAATSDNILHFTAKHHQDPRYFIIRIDHQPPLMLAIERMESIRRDLPSVLDASRLLTDDTGTTDQTQALQKAFEAANGTGKILYLPRGVYSTGQLHIREGHDFTIYFAPGCLLKVRASEHGENQHRHGLWLEDCHNVTIRGPGGIDHQAYQHYALFHNNYQDGLVNFYTSNERCPWITQSPLFMTGCQDILIDGLLIRNSRNFNLNARGCDNLVLRNIKILTPPASSPEYADGINTGSCRHVLVENCLVAANDDCFASGHYFDAWDHRAAADHVIKGMLGWNMRANAIRLGFYAPYDQGDFSFQDCCFVAMPSGSIIVHAPRPGKDGHVNRFGTIRLRNCTFATAEKLEGLFYVDKAAVDKLEVENMRFEGDLQVNARFVVEGNQASPIGQLILDHVNLNGKNISNIKDIPAKLSGITRIVVK